MQCQPNQVANGGGVVLSHDLVTWIAESHLPLQAMSRDDDSVALWMCALSNVNVLELNAVVKHVDEISHDNDNDNTNKQVGELLIIEDVENENEFERIWQRMKG